jgi:hypothetical protein
MKKVLVSLAFGLGVSLAAPALAQPPAAPAPDDAAAAQSSEEEEQAGWVRRLDEAAARVVAAQKNIARLTDAKGRGAARRYPRGDAKEKYLDDLEAARKELAEAEEALPEVVEEARRAGVPNGVLDRYENPTSNVDDEGAGDEDAESDS